MSAVQLETLRFHTVSLYGEPGRRWLEDLPGTIAACERRWTLTVGQPFQPLSYNYVAPADSAAGTRVVLKLCFPGSEELLSQPAALQHWAGRGAVRLLDWDATLGAILMERIEPGIPLTQLEDDEAATAIAAEVMAGLHGSAATGAACKTVGELRGTSASSAAFTTVAELATWFDRGLRPRYQGGSGPLPAPMVARAERLFAELIATSAAPVLCHGDLHHYNILQGADGRWLAIDPKGVLAEPAYDCAMFLLNPAGLLQRPSPRRVIERRIDILAEARGFDRARLVAWGYAFAMLSAAWSAADHGSGWESALGWATLMEPALA